MFMREPPDNLAASIHAHLRQERVVEDRLTAIKRLTNEILGDQQWLNTLEDGHPELEAKKNAVRDAMLRGDKADIEIARVDLVIAYKVAANKLAAINLELERQQAIEDAMVSSYELHMMERCE